MPLGARSAGHYRVPAGWSEAPVRKHFVEIFWGVEGSGSFAFSQPGTVRQTLGPGELTLYFPGDVHDLGTGSDAPWEYRWWTMDGPLAEAITREFGFEPGRVYSVGPPPEALFEELTRRLGEISRAGEARAAALAYELLSTAHGAAHPLAAPNRNNDQAFSARCLEIIHRRWADPGFGIDQLAAELGLHRSVVSRRFHAAQGLAPSDYLGRWRVQHALSRLKESNLPIQAVAASCGWEDANYFARRIRQATGLSPSQFRAGRG